jgi:hypothetical protein
VCECPLKSRRDGRLYRSVHSPLSDLRGVPHGVLPERFDIPSTPGEKVDNAVGEPSSQPLVISIGPERDMPITNPARATICGGYAAMAYCLSANFRVELYRFERSSKTPPTLCEGLGLPRLYSDDH